MKQSSKRLHHLSKHGGIAAGVVSLIRVISTWNAYQSNISCLTVTRYTIAAAIWRQDSAQRRHDWAQRWQWSWSCFSHSVAQRAHASAQTRHNWAWRSEWRDIKRAQMSQVSAQSRHNLIHCAIICTVSLSKQAVAQFSQSRRQSKQFLMQVSRRDWWDWVLVIVLASSKEFTNTGLLFRPAASS